MAKDFAHFATMALLRVAARMHTKVAKKNNGEVDKSDLGELVMIVFELLDLLNKDSEAGRMRRISLFADLTQIVVDTKTHVDNDYDQRDIDALVECFNVFQTAYRHG